MDRRVELEKALARLWEAIDGTRQVIVGHDKETGEPYTASESLAPLVRELRAVTKELADLGAPVSEGNPLDEIAARREARRAGAGDPAPTTRRSQPRRRG